MYLLGQAIKLLVCVVLGDQKICVWILPPVVFQASDILVLTIHFLLRFSCHGILKKSIKYIFSKSQAQLKIYTTSQNKDSSDVKWLVQLIRNQAREQSEPAGTEALAWDSTTQLARCGIGRTDIVVSFPQLNLSKQTLLCTKHEQKAVVFAFDFHWYLY